MTLKRLMIALAVLVVLAGVGIMWLWQYAYTPEGRARTIIAQIKNESATASEWTLRGWMLQHHLVRPCFPVGPRVGGDDRTGADAMVDLGHEVFPVVIEALQDDDKGVQFMAILACGRFRDPAAIEPLAKWMRKSDPRDFIQRAFCMRSMVTIGPKAYGPLVEAFRNLDSDQRNLIPTCLAELWGAAAVPYLIELLEDSDGEVRQIAACELGKLKDSRGNAPLIRHLNDPRAGVRIESLGAIGELHDPRNIPAVRKLLDDSNLNVHNRAASVLKDFGVQPLPASQPGKP